MPAGHVVTSRDGGFKLTDHVVELLVYWLWITSLSRQGIEAHWHASASNYVERLTVAMSTFRRNFLCSALKRQPRDSRRWLNEDGGWGMARADGGSMRMAAGGLIWEFSARGGTGSKIPPDWHPPAFEFWILAKNQNHPLEIGGFRRGKDPAEQVWAFDELPCLDATGSQFYSAK